MLELLLTSQKIYISNGPKYSSYIFRPSIDMSVTLKGFPMVSILFPRKNLIETPRGHGKKMAHLFRYKSKQ